jgi:hypothetical protein
MRLDVAVSTVKEKQRQRPRTAISEIEFMA